jgi:hypothetical protein
MRPRCTKRKGFLIIPGEYPIAAYARLAWPLGLFIE